MHSCLFGLCVGLKFSSIGDIRVNLLAAKFWWSKLQPGKEDPHAIGEQVQISYLFTSLAAAAILVHRRIMLELLRDDYLSHFENLKEKRGWQCLFSFCCGQSARARAHVFHSMSISQIVSEFGTCGSSFRMFVIFFRHLTELCLCVVYRYQGCIRAAER